MKSGMLKQRTDDPLSSIRNAGNRAFHSYKASARAAVGSVPPLDTTIMKPMFTSDESSLSWSPHADSHLDCRNKTTPLTPTPIFFPHSIRTVHLVPVER